MIGFGSKPTPNSENCTLIATILANYRRFSSNCTNRVRYIWQAENLVQIFNTTHICETLCIRMSVIIHKTFHSQTDDGEDDLKKGTQLLEIYALEIQMYTVFLSVYE